VKLCSGLRQEIATFGEKARVLENEAIVLKGELDSATKGLSRHQQESRKLGSALEEMRMLTDSLQQEIGQLSLEKASTRSELKALRKRYEQESRELGSVLVEQKAVTISLRQEMSKLSLEKGSVDAKLEALCREKAEWVEGVKNSRELRQMKRDLKQAKLENEELRKENNAVSANAEAVNSKYRSVNGKLVKLAGHANHRQKVQLHMQMKKEIAELQKRNQELSRKLTQKQKMLEKMGSESTDKENSRPPLSKPLKKRGLSAGKTSGLNASTRTSRYSLRNKKVVD